MIPDERSKPTLSWVHLSVGLLVPGGGQLLRRAPVDAVITLAAAALSYFAAALVAGRAVRVAWLFEQGLEPPAWWSRELLGALPRFVAGTPEALLLVGMGLTVQLVGAIRAARAPRIDSRT